MKIRNAESNRENAELNMTSMIDIVFQLLVFFIMTFKITAMEGDIKFKRPRASQQEQNIEQEFDEPIRVQLKSSESGEILDIIVNGESKPNFKELTNHVVGLAGQPGPERDKTLAEREVEFDCDYDLHFSEVISAITAVGGKRKKDGEIDKLFQKFNFKDNGQSE